jgi:cytochrome c-type biogenesis protein
MNLLTTGSVLAAFFAGGVALFAPCCIVFLAPSYLAAAVKNRRFRLLPLTFLFAAGLALVMVPITLGISLIAGTIARYHTPLYYAGGALMLALAAFSLTGRMWSLPGFIRAPDAARGDSASFFALGVFSGIASSCCAPVLAGVMTLSALSGSAIGGVGLGLAYVLGMTFPLFVMALAWDRLRLDRRSFLRARAIRVRLGGRTLVTNTVNLAVAVAFAVMGGFIIYLAGAGTMTRGPGFQVAIGRALARVFARIEAWARPVPEPVLGLAVLGIAAVFVYATLRDRHRDARPAPPDDPHEPARAVDPPRPANLEAGAAMRCHGDALADSARAGDAHRDRLPPEISHRSPSV